MSNGEKNDESTAVIKELQDGLKNELDKEKSEEHLTTTTSQLSFETNPQNMSRSSLIARLEEKEREHQRIVAMKDEELDKLRHKLEGVQKEIHVHKRPLTGRRQTAVRSTAEYHMQDEEEKEVPSHEFERAKVYSNRPKGEMKEEVKRLKKCNDELAKQVNKQDNELFKIKMTLEGKCQVIEGLQGIIEKYKEEGKGQLEEQIRRAEEVKLKAVTEVVDQLHLTETQCAVYKADLEIERNDRQRIHQELTFIQTELDKLIDKYHKSEQTIENLTEDKKALTEQVNNYKIQVEKLNRIIGDKTNLIRILQESIKESRAEVSLKRREIASQQQEIVSKQEEIDSLQMCLSTVNSRNCKISHTEVTLEKEELGRGGWGVVWKGNFRQNVAIKQIHPFIVNNHNLELLDREINIMAQLYHPNLLQFMGAVCDHPSGNPLIITEMMDTSLRKAYEEKELTPDQQLVILSIMRDVAVGLNYLHCLPDPIIHRDVSSANVLLRPNDGPSKWIAKLSDFGSAKIARLAVTNAAGAVSYAAPESVQNIMKSGPVQKQTTKMDVFSYGILLCEILTCTFPERDFFQGMLDQVQTTPNIGPTLCPVIVSCGDDDPVKRPTMKYIIDVLSLYFKDSKTFLPDALDIVIL